MVAFDECGKGVVGETPLPLSYQASQERAEDGDVEVALATAFTSTVDVGKRPP